MVADLKKVPLLNVAANIPQLVLNTSRVGQLHIVELLVGKQIGHQLHVFLWYAARDQLVQDGRHILFGKSPALQQNFADSKDLTICHQGRLISAEEKTFLLAVINYLSIIPAGDAAFSKVGSDIVNVSLHRALIDAESQSLLRLIQSLSGTKTFIHVQNPAVFGLVIRHSQHLFL